MSRKITFDELVARREQRENDKLKVGMLTIPGTGVGLEARMPPQKAVLELYGELGSAKDTLEALHCGNHALYVCCPQLQDRALQKELGVDENPMGILDVLFTPVEQDQLGGEALRFLGLLPPEKAALPAARAEAKWLADTAVVQSAAIARNNRIVLFGWLNNILVNSNLRDRGLCWQVQQDLYRDMRRRPVKFFRVGLTIRDHGTGREHSCVYVNAAGGGLQGSIVLDAWKNCGHLVVLTQKDREGGKWEEDWREPFVSKAFPEGHSYGMDHHLVWPGWARKRPLLIQRIFQSCLLYTSPSPRD